MAKTQKQTAGTIETMQADYEAAVLEADEVLRQIVSEGRSEPNAAEQIFFRAKVSWERPQVIDELSRMERVTSLQRVAGTPDDRAAAEAEAAAAAEAMEAEVPKLEAEIEQLLAKKRGYEAAAFRSARRLQEYREAVAALRKWPPEHIRNKSQRMMLDAHRGIRNRLSSLQNLKVELLNLQQSRGSSNDGHRLAEIRKHAPEAVRKVDLGSGRFRYELTPAWDAAKQRFNQKIKQELNPAIEVVEAELEAAEAEAEAMLDFYAV